MLKSTQTALVDELRHELGDDLRLVGRYDDHLDVLYVRDDVEARRSRREYDHLHARVLEDHNERAQLEEQLQAGRFQASVLAFEDMLGANLLGRDGNGHVTTVERDADLDLQRFLRRFDVVSAAVRQFQTVEFEHEAGDTDCPRCGSGRTISIPEAGPSAPYHCLTCDSGFS